METNIYKKLFKVKKAGIKLQRDTKAFNYKYATLAQIQEKLGTVLEEQGLLVIHSIWNNCVTTRIIDIEKPDENLIMSSISMSEWTKPQDKGSEITYYRRYNLLSLLDLEVEDDDWKKAQDSSYSKKEEPADWFWEENLEKFKQSKDKFNKETAVKACREKYKVSREWAGKIEWLYN